MERLAGLGPARPKAQSEEKGAVREHARCYITSLADIGEFASAARKRWGMENNLYRFLDAMLMEDASCVRKGNSPLNLNALREAGLFSCLRSARRCPNATKEDTAKSGCGIWQH